MTNPKHEPEVEIATDVAAVMLEVTRDAARAADPRGWDEHDDQVAADWGAALEAERLALWNLVDQLAHTVGSACLGALHATAAELTAPEHMHTGERGGCKFETAGTTARRTAAKKLVELADGLRSAGRQ